jgi:excisionase family DNA binding protein
MAMPADRTPERLLTVEDVAERLQVTRESVRRYLRTKQLAGTRLGTKAGWRIREADLERFMEARQNIHP